MLQFARGEAFGEGVRDLLELQRAFHGDRIADMTAKEQERLRIDHLGRRLLDGIGLRVEDPLDLAGHLLERIQRLRDLVAEHRALDLRQIQAQHVGGGDLRDERLRGGHGDFRASVRVQHRIGFARNGGALRIADGQHLGTLLAGVAQRHQRVHRLAGL